MLSDFINSFIATERLARSGPGRCHSTQFNDRNIAKSIVSFSVPCATYHWHLARVFTILLLVLERLNGFGTDRLFSARNDDSNIMRPIAICFVPHDTYLWHVARDLTNLVIAAEDSTHVKCPLPPPPLARAPYTAQPRLPQWHMPASDSTRSTRFETRVFQKFDL